MNKRKYIVVGLSGPSSSGKSTLAKNLNANICNSVIVHQDDFYKSENELPRINNIPDWDSPESIDYEKMIYTLEYIKYNDKFPNDFKSIEETIERPMVLKKSIDNDQFDNLNTVLNDHVLVLVDGFMMYNNKKLMDLFDIKILLNAPHDLLKDRRDARNGYVTAEGFWQDPPHYFDNFVWPSYIKYHKQYFKDQSMTEPSLLANHSKINILNVQHETPFFIANWAACVIYKALTTI